MFQYALPIAIAVACHASPAAAQPVPGPTTPSTVEPVALQMGGYLQPTFRLRQNDDVAQFDEDGFGLHRVRLLGRADQRTGCVELGLRLEGELTPSFELLDAFGHAAVPLAAGGRVEVDVGQVKAPLSRQTLVSDAELAFPEKAALTTLAPDRQLGVRAGLHVPGLPLVAVRGGVFNGEGRNQVDNIDEHFLWVGRLEITPLGRAEPLGESVSRAPVVALAGSAARNVRVTGDSRETRRWLGADLYASAYGAAFYAEYLDVATTYPAGALLPTSHANGVNVQVVYRLPLPPPIDDRVEVGARLEEIDRNDTIPIEQAGDANQSSRSYLGVVSYYHRGHDLKVQASFAHVVELEDLDTNDADARYPNDTLLVQLTYRVR